MEFIKHGDLGEYMLRRGPLPEEEAKDVVWQVSNGLKVMHQYGITHRDLKPAVSSIFLLCIQSILATWMCSGPSRTCSETIKPNDICTY